MIIKVQKIEKDACVPQAMHQGDAALDLYAYEDVILKPGERVSCRTGIAIKVADGYAGLIWDRSGLSHKNGIKTLGGVIDSNYTGEWRVGLVNLGQEDFEIKKGYRIAQVLFQRVIVPEIVEVDMLDDVTERQNNALGSSGLR